MSHMCKFFQSRNESKHLFFLFFMLQFKLIVENSENLVAPGLQVKAFVEYCPEIEEDLQDSLPLLIEEDIVDIPLVGYAC